MRVFGRMRLGSPGSLRWLSFVQPSLTTSMSTCSLDPPEVGIQHPEFREMECLAVSRQLVVDVLSKFSAQGVPHPGNEGVIAELNALLSSQDNPRQVRVTCLGSFRLGGQVQA